MLLPIELDCGAGSYNHKAGAAVFLPALLAGFMTDGNLFTVAYRGKPGTLDAERDQIIFDGIRPLGAQSQVVLAGAQLIAVAFYFYSDGGIIPKPIGGSRQLRARVAGKIIAIKLEVNVWQRAAHGSHGRLTATQRLQAGLRLCGATLR